MKINRFEDIEIWQEARKFVNRIYKICNIGAFKKDYTLTNQVQRASISIMAKVAEGYARHTSKEFIQFLFIAKSSAAEIQSHLYIALDLGYISKECFDELYNQLDEIQRQTSGFIKYLRSVDRRG
jgi:four helix bundle protein